MARLSATSFLFGLLVLSVAPRATSTAQHAMRAHPVWVDLDNSAGLDARDHRDVDDALALVQALNSPELRVVGISATFGNAGVRETFEATRALLGEFFPEAPKLHMGADGPGEDATPAVEALRVELERQDSMDILALGALTNVAALVSHHGELARRIGRVVFVGGRRPGDLFRVGRHNPRTLPDLNFEKDVAAVEIILSSSIPLVLAPFELSAQIHLRQEELGSLAAASSAASRWLAAAAAPWLSYWQDTFRVDYFYPYDCLAVLYMTHPHLLECNDLAATIDEGLSDDTIVSKAMSEGEPSVHGVGVATKQYLHVRGMDEPDGGGAATVRYCHTPSQDARKVLLQRLTGKPIQKSEDEL